MRFERNEVIEKGTTRLRFQVPDYYRNRWTTGKFALIWKKNKINNSAFVSDKLSTLNLEEKGTAKISGIR